MVVMVAPEQMVCAAGVATTLSDGLTRTLAEMGVPGQLFAVGVMLKNTVMVSLVLLVSVPLMLPLPLAAMPVTEPVLLRVQLYVVPATLPERTIVVMGIPEQTFWEAGVATALGIGLTSTVAVMGAP